MSSLIIPQESQQPVWKECCSPFTSSWCGDYDSKGMTGLFPSWISYFCLCVNTIENSSLDRLRRPGKETDGRYGGDRYADCGWRGRHLAGSHHRFTAEARSSRCHRAISHLCQNEMSTTWSECSKSHRWMLCDDRIKWVAYQSDSSHWALTIPWVQAFTSSVTTGSSKYPVWIKDPDFIIIQPTIKCAIDVHCNCFYLRDITSATLSILRGETVPVDVLQIKVRHCFC